MKCMKIKVCKCERLGWADRYFNSMILGQIGLSGAAGALVRRAGVSVYFNLSVSEFGRFISVAQEHGWERLKVLNLNLATAAETGHWWGLNIDLKIPTAALALPQHFLTHVLSHPPLSNMLYTHLHSSPNVPTGCAHGIMTNKKII